MTGSLQEKRGKYYAVINLKVEGKRKQKWVYTGYEVMGNKKKAQKALRDILREYELKEDIIRTDISFSDYIRHWLTTIKISVDIITYQGYEASAKTHILPYFDNTGVKLEDINYMDIQEYFNLKYASGRVDGKGGLSPKTLRTHKIVIQQSLKEAVRHNLLLSNPCEFVKLPQLERYDYKYYSIDEMNMFLECIKDEPICDLIRLVFIYGLRRSEALGLKWDCFNFDTNSFIIKHTVSKCTKTVAKDKTKNKASYRSFPLNAEGKAIVMRAKQKETENKKLFGSEYYESDYIFKWEDGRPYSPDYVSHKFRDLLKRNNFRHIRFHDIRHSTASYLLSEGYEIKDVQEWLGHSDIKMTGNIYGHLSTQRKNKISEAMMNSLEGRPKLVLIS